MMTQYLYMSQIRTVLPNTDFKTIEQTGGQFHDVIVINGEWVFRFPRYREGVQHLLAETQLLDALGPQLPLPIPQPVHQRLDPPVPGLAFIGYRRLAGRPLLQHELDAVRDEPARDELAAQLAGFLRALHDLPLSDLPGQFPGRLPGQPPADLRPHWEAMYAAVREKLAPAMRPDARRAVSAHFEAYLDDPSLHSFDPSLRHGDFGGDNILWDPAAARITGVIDFSSCQPGDPAIDLASASTLGSDLFDRLAERYSPDPARRAALLARARFYRGTYALEEALSGLQNGDDEAYQHGMLEYIP